MKRGLNLLVDDGTAAPSSHNFDVEAGLTAATAMGSHVFRPVMPWESTPSLRSVFKQEKFPWLHLIMIPRSFPAVSSSGSSEVLVTKQQQKLIICDASHEVAGSARDLDRDQVLLKWLEVILLLPDESRAGMSWTTVNGYRFL